jgi:hypothetical protein
MGPQRPVPAPPEILDGARDWIRIAAPDAGQGPDGRQYLVPRQDPLHRLVAVRDRLVLVSVQSHWSIPY